MFFVILVIIINRGWPRFTMSAEFNSNPYRPITIKGNTKTAGITTKGLKKLVNEIFITWLHLHVSLKCPNIEHIQLRPFLILKLIKWFFLNMPHSDSENGEIRDFKVFEQKRRVISGKRTWLVFQTWRDRKYTHRFRGISRKNAKDFVSK